MYGKKRIVLSVPVGGSKFARVHQKGGKGSNNIGVWYYLGGKYYADLKSADQEYQLVKVADLKVKGFGGCQTKQELRHQIAWHRCI